MTPMNDDILRRFSDGLNEARGSVKEPEAMTLSTLRTDGGISSRVVLLKAFDARGFVFYTNVNSLKGRQLDANSAAALNFLWREIYQQVRVEGRAEAVTPEEADAYFASRPRGSQIGAWASEQSQPLDSRETLLKRVEAVEARFSGREVPRPDFWSGYRVKPQVVEFWYGSEHRLHDRYHYRLEDERWICQRLYP